MDSAQKVNQRTVLAQQSCTTIGSNQKAGKKNQRGGLHMLDNFSLITFWIRKFFVVEGHRTHCRTVFVEDCTHSRDTNTTRYIITTKVSPDITNIPRGHVLPTKNG